MNKQQSDELINYKEQDAITQKVKSLLQYAPTNDHESQS